MNEFRDFYIKLKYRDTAHVRRTDRTLGPDYFYFQLVYYKPTRNRIKTVRKSCFVVQSYCDVQLMYYIIFIHHGRYECIRS
jgi:hypothetical protein